MEVTSKIDLWKNRDRYTNRSPKLHLVENMTVESLLILGLLWSCRRMTSQEMAEVLNFPTKRVVSLLQAILRSRDGSIQGALRGRFPLGCSVNLPVGGKRVYCKRCNQRLCAVPCCNCLIRSQAGVEPRAKLEPDLPQDKPTKALPGTREKIEVMTMRASNGYSVFSARDITVKAMTANALGAK